MTAVRFKLQSILEFLNARLSKRIVYWVFLSIIVIEVIILVPSVLRRERELLGYLQALATAQGLGLLDDQTLTRLDGKSLLTNLQKLQTHEVVLGGALYQENPELDAPVSGNHGDGTLVGTFGEPPQLTLQPERQDYYWRWQNRYDAHWEIPALQGRYVLIVRHDAAWVRREFFLFIARIAGLVIIISVFVTGATLYVLRRLLIKPVLQLRQDLLLAGEAIRDDSDTRALAFESLQEARDDELGDVIAAFDRMFGQITEAIATCKQSENRFRTLVEQAVDAFFVVNQAGQIKDVNQNACDSLGYSRAELIRLTVSDVQMTFTSEDFASIWQQLQPGQPQTIEGWHRRKDGTGFPVEVRLGLLEMGPRRYILALARDITERKASEQALARLAEVGELAAMIVHEVRSPLTTVLMGLNSFRSMELSERARTRLDLALEESERLQKLLNEILMYSREQVLTPQEVEVNGLTQDVAAALMHSPTLGECPLEVITLDCPLVIMGDRDKLKQVFINLVSNACEASKAGDRVTWEVHRPHRNQLTITIHNQGDPIPPDLLPRLTKPFFTTKPTGNGLGLAITKRIVEAHQGELQITSSAQAGTEVRVTFPLVVEHRDPGCR